MPVIVKEQSDNHSFNLFSNKKEKVDSESDKIAKQINVLSDQVLCLQKSIASLRPDLVTILHDLFFTILKDINARQRERSYR